MDDTVDVDDWSGDVAEAAAAEGAGAPAEQRSGEAPIKVVLVVAAVLVRSQEDGKRRVLVARRPWGKFLEGLSELPGGKVEPGESPEQALRRELAEELGIRWCARTWVKTRRRRLI